MVNFEALKPRTLLYAAPKGGGKEKAEGSKEEPKKIPPQERKTGGREGILTKSFSRRIDRQGNNKLTYDPPGGMSAAKVDGIFEAKALIEKGLLTNLDSEFKRLVVMQIRNLGENVKAIGGTRPSGIRGLSASVARAVDEILKLASAPTTEETKPLYVVWTWLISNGFVLGDEKTYMGTLTADPKKNKDRMAEVRKFDDRKTELEAQMQDRIGEELDQIARWARAKVHNATLKQRVSDAKGKADLSRLEFQKMPMVRFPEKGLVAYLAAKVPSIPDFQRNELEKTARLPYASYAPVSVARKGEIQKAKENARETLPRKERKKLQQQEKLSKQQQKAEEGKQQELLDREKSEERLQKLRPMMVKAQLRLEKAQALLKEIDADLRKQPGPLRSIAIRIEPNLLKLHNEFLSDAKKFDKKDDRRIGDLVFGATRKTGPAFRQHDFDRLHGLFGRAERKHWLTLEKHINAVLGGIPEPARRAQGLQKVQLDKMNIKDLSRFIGNLKSAFGFIRGSMEARTTEDIKYLQEILPTLEQKLQKLNANDPQRQSLDSRIKYLKLITHPDYAAILTQEKANTIKKQAQKYRSSGVK